METITTIGTDEMQARHRRYLVRQGFGRLDRTEQWGRVRPELLPWIEVNQPHAVDAAVEGLLRWSHIADRAIVTTVPGEWKVSEALCNRVPNLRIVPGLKTNDVLTRFDDVDGWERIGVELADMAKRCGSDTVVLENESAIGRYGLGDEVLDWGKFRAAMEALPKNLRIIWYPGITGGNHEKQMRMARLCKFVVAVHGNVTLVDRSYGRPAAVKWHWSIEARKRLDSIGAPTIPMQYFYGPDKDYWQDEQILEALGHVKDAPAVMIFPGAKRFTDAAIGIRKALEGGAP